MGFARAAKATASRKYHKAIGRRIYLRWLASPSGPRQSPYLKRLALPFFARFALRTSAVFVVPTPATKILAIRHYARMFGLKTFVETGTYVGDTLAGVLDQFDRCVSIELSPALHQHAQKRFARYHHVKCLHGDSGKMLVGVLSTIHGAALFWLDAHHSGGDTASSGYDPIMNELSAIYAHRSDGHVILIDDANGHQIDDICSKVPSSHRAMVKNNIIRITPRPVH